MADGAVPTAIALWAAPVRDARRPDVERALSFLRASAREGGLGIGDVLDWPTYATSLHVLAEHRWQVPGWHEAAAAGAAFVRRQQRIGPAWGDADGGFAVGGQHSPQPPVAGHVDLSVTRFAVTALVANGARPDDEALVAAGRFAQRCAAGDGFVYATDPAFAKSGARERPYGSATADGALVLAAAGLPIDAPLTWLSAHAVADHNPGVTWPQYDRAMVGYWRSAAAEVFARFGGPPGWRERFIEAIEADRHSDGTWHNATPHQKEDEPVVATALALRTLHTCRGG